MRWASRQFCTPHIIALLRVDTEKHVPLPSWLKHDSINNLSFVT
ncbi:hypothetical protein CRENPOLYSF2_3970003 [Crenothrix polyspora]|uniref:Uncharacterized protein n=1 Tax=Crenothrix polyspora TaxID=360316 RepID=A0A1R4HDS2_9GAMM|nr:hypothetical protein CRENPOLYSF2_3970003 [Crenothrix polyspora]